MDAPVRSAESLDLFVNATRQFERALNWVDGIKEGLVDFLINPKRTIHVRFPVYMDDGSIKTFMDSAFCTMRCAVPARVASATTPA